MSFKDIKFLWFTLGLTFVCFAAYLFRVFQENQRAKQQAIIWKNLKVCTKQNQAYIISMNI